MSHLLISPAEKTQKSTSKQSDVENQIRGTRQNSNLTNA